MKEGFLPNYDDTTMVIPWGKYLAMVPDKMGMHKDLTVHRYFEALEKQKVRERDDMLEHKKKYVETRIQGSKLAVKQMEEDVFYAVMEIGCKRMGDLNRKLDEIEMEFNGKDIETVDYTRLDKIVNDWVPIILMECENFVAIDDGFESKISKKKTKTILNKFN